MAIVTVRLKGQKGVQPVPDPVLAGAKWWAGPVHINVLKIDESAIDSGNVRVQRIKRAAYRELKSLLKGDYPYYELFHVLSRGLVIMAKSMKRVAGQDDTWDLRIDLDKSQGLLDGAHLFLLADLLRAQMPKDMWVFCRVNVGYPTKMIPYASKGLNAGSQVQPMGIHNALGHMNWLKSLLPDDVLEHIAFKEGEDKPFRADEVISLINPFNLFSNPLGARVRSAYGARKELLRFYGEQLENFERMSAIVMDILKLSDNLLKTSSGLSGKLRNDSTFGGDNVDSCVVWDRLFQNKHTRLTFLGGTTQWRPRNGAFMPMLGAFRHLVKTEDCSLRWSIPFEEVLELVDVTCEQMIRKWALEVRTTVDSDGRKQVMWDDMANIVKAKQFDMAA